MPVISNPRLIRKKEITSINMNAKKDDINEHACHIDSIKNLIKTSIIHHQSSSMKYMLRNRKNGPLYNSQTNIINRV